MRPLLVPLLMLLGLLAGCEQSSPAEVAADCDPYDSRPDCYDLPDLGAHCAIAQVREQYVEGRFRASELPEWADPSLRAEAPVVYDLAVASRPFSGGEVRDRLRSWQRQVDLPVDDLAVTRCAQESTHDDVVTLFGPPQSG